MTTLRERIAAARAAVKAGLAQLLGAVGLLCTKLGNPVASKMVHEAAYELVLPKNES